MPKTPRTLFDRALLVGPADYAGVGDGVNILGTLFDPGLSTGQTDYIPPEDAGKRLIPGTLFDPALSQPGADYDYAGTGGGGVEPGFYLEADPTSLESTSSATSQLLTNLTGTLVFSKLSGDSRVSISTTGVITVVAPVFSNTPATFIARVDNLDAPAGEPLYIEAPVILVGDAFAPYIFDIVPTSAAGLSTRRQSSAYTGPLMRVRRSSDNTELDIGPGAVPDANGDLWLDEAALLAFAGAGSAFVRTWYDQSGNGRHYGQATQSLQPRIVNAGVVDKINGKPAIKFDGVDDFLECVTGDYLFDAGSASLAFVINSPNDTSGQLYCETDGTVASFGSAYWYTNTANGADIAGFIRNVENGTMLNSDVPLIANAYNNVPHIVSFVDTGTSITGYRDGVAGTPRTYARSGVFPLTNSVIGALKRASLAGYYGGHIGEAQMFTRAISSTDRDNIHASLSDAFGITI